MEEKFTLYRKIFSFLVLFYLVQSLVFGQGFSSSNLKNASVGNPTSLQFGPDGKLYVAMQDGIVKVFTITRNGANDYEVTNTEVIYLVKAIPNYNDDGTFYPSGTKRQTTGLVVAGTASDPLVYVSSSDYRMGAGLTGDVNLCTNSGVISKLYKESGVWKKIDLVRGLPRSEENHSPNGMQIHNNTLLISIGGFTNAGGPAKLWTYITEYALASAILSIDLAAIEAMPTKTDGKGQKYKYDIPTLDDPTRPNNTDGTDEGDPWGGNDGLNQAKIVPGGPVQIFASGFRNAYDVLVCKSTLRAGRIYTIDNGPNRNWGGYPKNEGTANINNDYPEGEPGSLTVNNYDGLEYIGDINSYTAGSYYGGLPVPIRANPAGAGLYTDDGTNRGWRNDNSNPNLPLPSDWPPVPVSMADSKQRDYHDPGTAEDKSLIYWETSVNGLCEYTYSGNAMYGDILAAAYDNGGNIYRVKLDNGHNVLNSKNAKKINTDAPFASGFGNKPLDIIAQGDGEIFEGTIWVATWGANAITVFEPSNDACPVTVIPNDDDDSDGFTNQDEIDNGTDRCSSSSNPSDHDGDEISDLNDNDDDNDGIDDKDDFFAIDPDNGLTTSVPTHYNLFNYDPGTGFFGIGFTGLMSNGSDDYLTLFDASKMISGGAAGALTVEEVPAGDALGNLNTQEYAFQFGVKVSGETGTITIKSAIVPQYFNQVNPVDDQSQGVYIGYGDQDNYLKMTLSSNGGAGGIEVVHEVNGVATSTMESLPAGSLDEAIIFYLSIDMETNIVYPKYSIDGVIRSAGMPITLTGKLLDAVTNSSRALAVGVIATSRNSGNKFSATWDYIEVYPGVVIAANKNALKAEDNINIYPNPGKDKVTININSVVTQKYKIRMYNNVGHEVKSVSVNHSPNMGDHEMDISELKEGIYYIHFYSEKEQRSSTIKMIKK